jgi:hypothetical protein
MGFEEGGRLGVKTVGLSRGIGGDCGDVCHMAAFER